METRTSKKLDAILFGLFFIMLAVIVNNMNASESLMAEASEQGSY